MGKGGEQKREAPEDWNRARKGEWLESFVARIEDGLLGEDFSVHRNQKSYDDDGTQIDELDIVIEGMVGSNPYSSLRALTAVYATSV